MYSGYHVSRTMPPSYQMYRIAEMARHKLIHEVAKVDYDYRRLVLHANLLDALLVEIDAFNERALQRNRERKDLAAVMEHHARLHGTREPVIFLNGDQRRDGNDSGEEEEAEEELEEDEVDESETEEKEGEEEDEVPPMLIHENESGSESDDGEDHEDEDQHVLSPTTSMGRVKITKLATGWDEEEGLELRRYSRTGRRL
jgi:hypothetical protein